MTITIEEMATFCKSKSLVYQNSEIYGGSAGFFDLGTLGVELNNNIKQAFWKRFVQEREDVVGIDGSIISHSSVWKASGHVGSFADKLVTCTKCKSRFRADHLIEDTLKISADSMSKDKMEQTIKEKNITCPKCSQPFSSVSEFNLMFKTYVGAMQDEESIAYLRPETAQLIFTNFKLIMDTARVKLPFGIAQTGKAFRNEISPRDFLFRCREFEQFEIEFFIHPDQKKCPLLKSKDKKFQFNILTAQAQESKGEMIALTLGEMLSKKMLDEWHVYWLKEYYQFFMDYGISQEHLRLREHCKDELAHYSSACFDIEYKFPFGWKEIHGNANRGQFDLKQHIQMSKQNMEVYDEESKTKIIPRVIEPSQGIGRAFLAFLYEAYENDEKRGNIVLKLDPRLAPSKVGVFPLVNKLEDQTRKLFAKLKKDLLCYYDRSGSIGRRYARADETAVPYCITFDFDSLNDKAVTIRDRNTTQQKRIKISKLSKLVPDLLSGKKSFDKL